MSARRTAPLIVVATLHIVTSPSASATYTCNRCLYRERVEGRGQVRAFVSHIRSTHIQACPTAANTGRTQAA